jgi:hypothetical protein
MLRSLWDITLSPHLGDSEPFEDLITGGTGRLDIHRLVIV